MGVARQRSDAEQPIDNTDARSKSSPLSIHPDDNRQRLIEELRLANEQLTTSSMYQQELIDKIAAQATQLRELNEQLILSNVRQHERTEQAMLETAQLTALLESLGEGVLVAEPNGQITIANPMARRITGLPATGSLSIPADWSTIDLRSLDGRPLNWDDGPLDRALRGEDFADYEILLVRPDGARRRITTTGSAVLDTAGRVAAAVVVIRDVTDIRDLERMKGEYTSLISHDLRAPLTVIIGYATMLSSPKGRLARKTVVARAGIIFRNARRMQRMIDDLLFVARMESGQRAVVNEPLDLGAVVGDVVDEVIDPDNRGRVQVDVKGHLLELVVDRDYVERVITNLVTNALKFSPPGSPVEIHVRPGDGHVDVHVVDHGPGIAPEQLAHIFDKYYATAAGVQRTGHGLGLYNSRMMVEALGGRIWVTSEVGKGSTFSFRLPAA
jgi:signal transduction histidine kinase